MDETKTLLPTNVSGQNTSRFTAFRTYGFLVQVRMIVNFVEFKRICKNVQIKKT